jgi:predicted permease
MSASRLLDEFSQDVRYALRSMRSSPAVTAVVILSLALGAGANTALFSTMYTVMLRALPVAHPEQLVELLQKYPGEPRGNGYWSSRSYEYYRDHNDVFSQLTGTGIDNVARVQPEGSEAVSLIAEHVVGNYFPVLGVTPAIGRLIGPDDGQSAVAVLSWSLWNSRFHRNGGVLGKRIYVNNAPLTIVGVAARGFSGLRVNAQTSVWIPAQPDARLNLVARLKPGVTLDQARSEMSLLYRFTIEERAARSSDPQVRQLHVELEPARAGLADVRDRVAQPLTALTAAVGVLLLLACVNIAGILLARAAGRTREMALRLGLGASRARLMRQVLTESLLLSLAGAAAGIVVARFALAALLRILDSGRAHERIHLEVRPDAALVLFTLGVAVLTGFLFGLAPALNAFRAAPIDALRQSGRAAGSRFQRVFGKGLVAAQVALAVLLLSSGALFIARLANLESTDLGFRRDHVLLVSLDPSRSGYGGERLSNAYRDLLERMHSLHGVRSASLSAPTPLMGAGASGFANAEGFDESPEAKRWISLSWVAPKYFDTIGTPILAGREFTYHDESNPRVTIINRTLARYYFEGRDPIGKRITMYHVTGTRDPVTYEIIGVAGDANYKEIRESERRAIYLPAFRGGGVVAGTFVLRTDVDPKRLIGDVSRLLRETVPAIPLASVTTLSDQIDSSIVPERLMASLSGLFAFLGALLAGIGLYGLMAYLVTRRTNEVGIRLALGATPHRVLRTILAEAFAIVAAGLLVGVPLALSGNRLAAVWVADGAGGFAIPLLVSVAAMIAVALLAAYVPARRAARIDPMDCLRYE